MNNGYYLSEDECIEIKKLFLQLVDYNIIPNHIPIFYDILFRGWVNYNSYNFSPATIYRVLNSSTPKYYKFKNLTSDTNFKPSIHTHIIKDYLKNILNINKLTDYTKDKIEKLYSELVVLINNNKTDDSIPVSKTEVIKELITNKNDITEDTNKEDKNVIKNILNNINNITIKTTETTMKYEASIEINKKLLEAVKNYILSDPTIYNLYNLITSILTNNNNNIKKLYCALQYIDFISLGKINNDGNFVIDSINYRSLNELFNAGINDEILKKMD